MKWNDAYTHLEFNSLICEQKVDEYPKVSKSSSIGRPARYNDWVRRSNTVPSCCSGSGIRWAMCIFMSDSKPVYSLLEDIAEPEKHDVVNVISLREWA
jgi:hypothetical protein